MDIFTAIFGTIVLIVVIALMIGSLYLGGGTLAVRRQVPQILVLVVGLALILFLVMPFLNRQFGVGAVGLLMLAASLLVWVAGRRRRVNVFTTPVTTGTGRTIAPRHFVALWIGLTVFFVVVAVVLAVALRPPA